MKDLAKTLRNLRKQYGYTQKFVAEKLGITYQSYQYYENGKVIPSLEKAIILADLYDISLDYLVGRATI